MGRLILNVQVKDVQCDEIWGGDEIFGVRPRVNIDAAGRSRPVLAEFRRGPNRRARPAPGPGLTARLHSSIERVEMARDAALPHMAQRLPDIVQSG